MRARTFVITGILLAACDSSADVEECVERARCIPSTFRDDGQRGKISGTVRRGEDGVAGAFVRIEASAGARSNAVATDVAGAFGLSGVSDPYDLTAALGADVITYRDVRVRWLDPSIEPAVADLPRSWKAHLDVRLEAPLPDGQSVAFFATGDGVYGASGDLASGLTVSLRDYTRTADVHAIAFTTAGGFATANAHALVQVEASAGAPRLVSFRLAPIELFGEPTFDVVAPPGMTADATVDVVFGYSRTSGALLAKVPVGVKTRLPAIPGAISSVHARARGDGAVSESGEVAIDLFQKTTIELPAAATAERPLDGELRGAGEIFAAIEPTAGVLEHVLEGPGATIRIVTNRSETALPDVSGLGVGASGAYAWSVRHYPGAPAVQGLAGVVPRRYKPYAQTKPRAVTLR